MVIERDAFTPLKTSEEREAAKGKTIGVWFNDTELENLVEYGVWLQQEKPATIIKQMIELGAKLIDDEKTNALRKILLNNARKNIRLGVQIVDPKIRKS